MFVAGGMMWANLNERASYLPDGGVQSRVKLYGWPRTAVSEFAYEFSNPPPRIEIEEGELVLDALISLLVIAASWFLCEWLIRRRAARKGA